MRITIYARYSTDNQKDTSIDDQVRVCRDRLSQMGISTTTERIYEDRATTGATMHLRPGIKQLMKDVADGLLDIVIAESLSRFARDQEDMAYIFKRLAFNEVQMMTVTRAEITEMDIGFESTISARYLKDCADQVRRGQRGQVQRGKNPGGLSYGYQVVKELDEQGELKRGLLEIDDDHAEVIRRIFEQYAAGKSPRAIVKELNHEGVPAPRGNGWRMSTINGDGKRGNGILRNQKYLGFLVWNRSHAVRNPDTGKRLFRMNPPDEWVVVEKPEWRIISDELWDAAQERRRRYVRHPERPEKSRRPSRLLSGLLRCGCCGGAVTIRNSGINGRGERHAARYGCAAYKDKSTCSSRPTIKQPDLEERVLRAIKENLMAPEAWKAFMEGYHQEKKEQRLSRRREVKSAAKEIASLERKIDSMLDAVADGLLQKSMYPKINAMSERKDELEQLLQSTLEEDQQPISLHPNLSQVFVEKIEDLQDMLMAGDELPRLQAREKIRDLIAKITLTPIDEGKDWEITIHGAVAEMIVLAGGNADGLPSAIPAGTVASRLNRSEKLGRRRDENSSVSPTMVAEVRDGRWRDIHEFKVTVRLHEDLSDKRAA
jgi:site-specific DNA recombinase